jgi:hypothetical protein
VFNETIALTVLNRWLSAEDPNQRWTATCSIILWFLWHPRTAEGYQELIEFMRRDAEMFTRVFVEIIDHKFHKRKAPSVFKQLVLQTQDEARRDLLSGMAKIPFRLIDERLLKRLRASGKPVFDSLVVDVRSERWRQLLPTPGEFSEDLKETLNAGVVSPEVYRALIELLKPEPEGCRRQAAAALADSFLLRRASLDKILKKLIQLAPSTLGSFSVEVRREHFRRLLHIPDVFVQTVAEYFVDNNTAAEASKAMTMLAQPEPEGYREDLLQALASGYVLNQNETRRLLDLVRAGSEAAPRLLVHEFTARLLEGLLSNPSALYLYLARATSNPDELADVVHALTSLAISEPWGQRKTLVRALAQARIPQADDVDNLLQHPALQSVPGLAGLHLEVRLTSALDRFFMPRFLTRFFTPR